ncbi:MAG: 3-hydroxyacyl-CoA dehydrogenase NAD-binding domain-containing protein, partial [Candidatus Planktophila sp.]
MALTHVRIVGSGLIGSSIGLALTAKGISVTMVDVNPAAAQLAQDLMRSTPSEKSQVTLVASPLSTVSEVIAKEIPLGLNVGFLDISSVKVKPVIEVSAIDLDMSYF